MAAKGLELDWNGRSRPGAGSVWPPRGWGQIGMAAPGLGWNWNEHPGPPGDVFANPGATGRRFSQGHFCFWSTNVFLETVSTSCICSGKTGPKKWGNNEITGNGPKWRDPQRNSAPAGLDFVQNGWMVTQLVTKMCDLGSLGVPGLASTHLGPGPSLGLSLIHI